MKEIILASNNKNKIKEIKEIFRHTNIGIISLREAGIYEDPEETEDTFKGNALLKADHIFKLTNSFVMADDSGLSVRALNWAPGVYSKRFSKEQTDSSNNSLLLEKMQGKKDRFATYNCAVGFVGPDVRFALEETCEGHILKSPKGEGGFGYDPLFAPKGFYGRSMAMLNVWQKHSISHRGKAFTKLLVILNELNMISLP